MGAWALVALLGGVVATGAMAASPAPASQTAVPVRSALASGATVGQAFVPVARFWSPRRDISLDGVRSAIEGTSETYSRVVIASEDPSGLWAALGVTPAASTTSGSVDEVAAAVEGSRRTLGLVPLTDVRPDLRALTIDGASLFGVGRLADQAAWPLAVAGGAAPESEATWILAAAGDVMLDREVYRQSVLLDKGPQHPWDGGFAEITSRTCCTISGGNAITTKRVGPRGAVRELLSSADVAVVNHEGPAPDDFSYHPSGLVFTFDPSLLKGVREAGVDLVSLGNNHIRNAGSAGVLETMRNVRRAGMLSMGAGKDADRARQPACLDQGEVRVCFLAYDAINTAVHAATSGRPGAAGLRISNVRSDIRRSRQEGADVIVVMPHWGTEYTTRVTPQQRRWARAMVKAGADVVLGAHSHVAGPVELIDGVPVLYSMGDFLFDLPRFEETEEAFVAELTFQGSRLAQLDLHPTVIVDRSQVNLLDPAGDGAVVLKRMRAASERLD